MERYPFFFDTEKEGMSPLDLVTELDPVIIMSTIYRRQIKTRKRIVDQDGPLDEKILNKMTDKTHG